MLEEVPAFSTKVRVSDDEIVAPEIDFSSTVAPLAVDEAPGMTTPAERRFVYGLVARHHKGCGALVDAGSFLGGSLVAAAQGLRDSGRESEKAAASFPEGKPIHGYELGSIPWRSATKPAPTRTFGNFHYTFGESFVPTLERAAAPYADIAALHIGDITQTSWGDMPIEYCFLDVCKDAEINAFVTRTFFPALIPNRSILIQQDFFFYRLPFIKITMNYLSEYFEWIGQIHTSAVFMCRKRIPPEVARYDPFLARDPRLSTLHDSPEWSILGDEARFWLDLSRAHLTATTGRADEAIEMITSLPEVYGEYFARNRAARARREPNAEPDAWNADLRITQALNEIRRDQRRAARPT